MLTGSKILYTIPILGGINITDTLISSWIVVIILIGLCFFLTYDLKVRPTSKRQALAEMIVNFFNNIVSENMGKKFAHYTPFIAALFSLSALSNLISMTGLQSPTKNLSMQVSWSIIVLVLITYYKLKAGGVLGYLKSFTKPVFILTPLNILSEFATPVSMTFRHFGNVTSGIVINSLLYTGLAAASTFVIGWIGGFIGSIPILQVGIPAVLSIYFDLFTGILQSYIYIMLTMIFVSSAAEE